MTRIEFEWKCNEAGLHCFKTGNVEREGEHFRVMLEPKSERGVAEDRYRKSLGMG